MINRNKTLVAVGTLLVAAVAIGAGVFFLQHEEQFEGPQAQSWYTTDDGATYFAGPVGKASPFERQGKQAYRCTVFTCSDGKKFVGYLVRDPVKGSTEPTTRPGPAFGDVKPVGTGANGWVSQVTAEGAAILQVNCPDGAPATPVAP